jgi:hypothetical protein
MNPKTCVRRGTTQNSFSRKDMMMILVNTVGQYQPIPMVGFRICDKMTELARSTT